jgi:hypothetical protein
MTLFEQFIYGADGKPLFAVIPYEIYSRFREEIGSDSTSEDAGLRFVRLPHGGPKARLDVVKLVELLIREKIYEIPVNQRAQSYDKFPKDQKITLDPLIRRYFLGMKSPYVNTMQATNEVIESLVRTGIFERSKMKHEAFYRAINSVKLNKEKADEFLKKFAPLSENEKIILGV